MLKGKQKNLDANKDGKISGDDFAMLRSKKEPKDRGMGLQDEQLPPGKMVAAKKGKMIKKDKDMSKMHKMPDGKMMKNSDMEKKMGGGMIDPTMANYQKGGSVMARGSKLAKVRPTKLY